MTEFVADAAQLLVRTITAFVNVSDAAHDDAVIYEALQACASIAAAVEQLHVPVQTIRIVLRTPHTGAHALAALLSCNDAVRATRPFERVSDAICNDVVNRILSLEAAIERQRASLRISVPVMLSVGAVTAAGELPLALQVVCRTHATIMCALQPIDGRVPDAVTYRVAETIAAISRSTPGGFGNFRFGATAYSAENTPFFPAAHAWGSGPQPMTIALGFEHVRLCIAALQALWSTVTPLDAQLHSISRALTLKLNAGVGSVVTAALGVMTAMPPARVSHTLHVDTSLAPTPDSSASVMQLFNAARVGRFGAAGTLEVCSLLTHVFKSIELPTGAVLSGYCGLMLPPMEDAGLARDAPFYSIAALLNYSAVCGVGLDTVPIPGDASVDSINRITRDVAALALRLKKPLSVRLFPVPGSSAGETTTYDSPYMCNTAVFELE